MIKAANEFRDKTTAPNEMWQTDFTYLKIIGWGWHYLSTILDGFSRYVIAWKLCTTMKAEDVGARRILVLMPSLALVKQPLEHRRLLHSKIAA